DGAPQAASGGEAKLSAAPGEHTIVVTAPGKLPFKKAVSLKDGATVNVNVRLHSAPAAKTQQTAEKKQQGGSGDGYLLDPFGNKKKWLTCFEGARCTGFWSSYRFYRLRRPRLHSNTTKIRTRNRALA